MMTEFSSPTNKQLYTKLHTNGGEGDVSIWLLLLEIDGGECRGAGDDPRECEGSLGLSLILIVDYNCDR